LGLGFGRKGAHSPPRKDVQARMAKGRSPLAIVFVTVLIDLIGFGIVIPILPLYADHFGASATTVGFLLAIYSAMQFVCSPILGKLSDRVGRRPVLLASIVGTSLGFLIMGLARTLWLLFLARIVDGITGGNISTAAAYIADVTVPEERSRGMGLIGAAFGIGLIVGPAVGGLLSHISMPTPFLFAAALAAVNAVALYFFLPESLKDEHREQARRVSILQILSESVGWQLRGVLIAPSSRFWLSPCSPPHWPSLPTRRPTFCTTPPTTAIFSRTWG
jgi:multidrug resistance protein